jgi:hypothetical protein
VTSYAIPILILLAGSMAWSEGAPSLEKRVLELEQRQEQFERQQSLTYSQSLEGTGRVNSYFGENLSFGGFFESAITSISGPSISGPDTESQASARSNLLGLNLTSEFNSRFRFVSQIITGLSYSLLNPHNNPTLTPNHRQFGTPALGVIPAQAYVEYSHAPSFNIQTGLGYVPFGNSFQQREPVLFKRRGGPQMASSGSSSSVGIAFPLWMGLHIHGNFPVDSGHWGYNLYSFTPSLYSKSLGGGSRMWWAPSENLTLGISGQSGRQSVDTYYAYGADLNLKSGQLGLIAEYAQNQVTNGKPTTTSYYAEPYISSADGTWLVYGAADYLDNPSYTVSTTPDPYQLWSYGGGVNWLPISYIRYRVGVLAHEYVGPTSSVNGQERRYYSLDLSCGVAF